jgi:HK97 family phage prohead protease
MNKAWSVLSLKSIDPERREFEKIASTPSVDRVGDIVEPLGARFDLPLPLLHHHKHDAPVGHVISARPSDSGISIVARIVKVLEPGILRDRVDTASSEVKAGLVRGLSIGFQPLPEATERTETGLRFRVWRWLELSLVTVPAQSAATISLIRSIDRSYQSSPRHVVVKLPKKSPIRTRTNTMARIEERRAEAAFMSWAKEVALLQKVLRDPSARLTLQSSDLDRLLDRLAVAKTQQQVALRELKIVRGLI